VYENYGPKNNRRLLVNYGFAIDDDTTTTTKNNTQKDGFCLNEVISSVSSGSNSSGCSK